MQLEIRRLSHALGAEVRGVDLSGDLSKDEFDSVKETFLKYQVLLFRDQLLTREQHVAFSRRFGSLDKNEAKAAYKRATDYPEVSLVINRPNPDGTAPSAPVTGQDWHSDRSHLPAAASASLLRCIKAPDVGGDTMFANMYRAYDSLSEGMRAVLANLHGIHLDHPPNYDTSTPEAEAESRKANPAAAQPVLRVHEETKRIALYVNDEVRHFVGMTADESRPIINYLTRQATRPENVYRHQWRDNDLVMWDNRCVLHIALADYDRTQVRHMERTTVNADVTGYVYEGPIE